MVRKQVRMGTGASRGLSTYTVCLCGCIFLVLLFGNNAAAQNASVIECYTGAAVLRTLEHKTRDYKKTIAAFDLINWSNYDNWKTVLNVSIDVPFEWSTSDSFEQFHEKLERYKSEHRYSSNEADSIDDLHSFLPPEGWHAVETCLREQRASFQGGILPSLAVTGIPDRLGGFSLQISFPDNGGGSRPVIVKVEPDPDVISCQADSLDSVIGVPVLPSGNQVLCKRITLDAGTVIVRTSWGVASANFGKVETAPAPLPPPPPNPILQYVGTWKGVRYEMASDSMGYVTVKYIIREDGTITIHEYDYNTTRDTKAVFINAEDGVSFREILQGDGVPRKATATLAHSGSRIPDKPGRPAAEACGERCLDITVFTADGDGVQQEGFLTLQ